MNVKQLIKNWYVGNNREKVPPFILLDYKYVGQIGSGKTKLRHMKCVMQVIERIEMMESIYKVREG